MQLVRPGDDMERRIPDGPDLGLLAQARLAQSLTVAWMVVELGVALASGLAARSVALVAFGIDSGIELLTASVVMRQLVRRGGDAGRESLERGERNASRIVGWALLALIVYIVASSAYALVTRGRAEASIPGIALAAAASIIMPVLWRWRLVLARRLGSPALKADAACSLVCVWMSAVLLGGLLLNRLLGWWWADALAALGMIPWIRGEALEALEAARTGERCGCGD